MTSGWGGGSVPLLDRLTQVDGLRRELSIVDMKASLLRDLQWLLNTQATLSNSITRSNDQISGSVLAYGMPSLSGRTSSTIDLRQLERQIADVIRRFEPRLITQSVDVHSDIDSGLQSRYNQVGLSITALIRWKPTPVDFRLRAQVDLESQRMRLHVA